MKQSLQMRVGQELRMTPQLQQAIRLLQLSTVELQEEIQELLETNPLLEEGEDDHDSEVDSSSTTVESEKETATKSEASSEDTNNELELQEQEKLPDELPVDSDWEDTYEPAIPSSPSSSASSDFDSLAMESKADSLYDHLLWQVNSARLNATDEPIALAIIDSIDETGYLTTPIEAIYDDLHQDNDLELEDVLAVLQLIQRFDPNGVGARDLQECLSIQLSQLPAETNKEEALIAVATALVNRHFDLLANREYSKLARLLHTKQDELTDVIQLIQTLHPKPGYAVAEAHAEYVVPDVYVRREQDRWRVELNESAMPSLRISPFYASVSESTTSASDGEYLKNNMQEARWFLKSLNSRNETLLKVSGHIVEKQRGFMENGALAMRALTLNDIAEAIGMHESTVSRVTTNKFIQTPQGIFELKYFFSSQLATSGGSGTSGTAVRARIKQIIAEENAQKPISDSKLAKLLEEDGIKIARRTVAKYRESLSIPPSNERKRLT